jgi:exopolysaccharide production protein ExoZ
MFETAELTRTTSAGPQRSGSVETIQFLRFLAAMAVVLFHGHNASTAHVYQGLGYLFDMGAAGVHVFFVISGFVIMYTSYGSGDAGMPTARFLLKRFVRIFPIYWMCCVAYVAYHILFGSGYDLPLSRLLGAIFLMPGDSSRIIGPGWTLSFELFFYLSFAAILRLRALPAITLLTGLFVATIAIGLVIRFPALLGSRTTHSSSNSSRDVGWPISTVGTVSGHSAWDSRQSALASGCSLPGRCSTIGKSPCSSSGESRASSSSGER